jgi:hypothetical protein
MGEFTQNLLKLTEFPFSYSLMGLLALIFGHGINPGELSFAKIGPLLILMGFVATTLSICDPVGSLLRLIIKGRSIFKQVYNQHLPGYGYSRLYLVKAFGESVFSIPAPHEHAIPYDYLFAIRYAPEDMLKKGYRYFSSSPYSTGLTHEAQKNLIPHNLLITVTITATVRQRFTLGIS